MACARTKRATNGIKCSPTGCGTSRTLPLQVFNRGLPAEVISPRCPGYADSAKPSLMERYQRHCIDLDPDLVVIAQSLNDMRAGMPLQEYLADLGAIVADIQAQTAALVVTARRVSPDPRPRRERPGALPNLVALE